MLGVCPVCGARASAEAFFNDPDARRFCAILGEIAFLGENAFRYIGLFRDPEGKRSLQWKRSCKLLAELRDMIKSGHVQRGSRVARPTTNRMWQEAIEKMINLPPSKLPLKNHEYLKEIVWTDADRYDREAEVRKNQMERTHTLPQQNFTQITPEEMQEITQKNYKERVKKF